MRNFKVIVKQNTDITTETNDHEGVYKMGLVQNA